MATILSRIFLLYNLLNATILYLVPKKLRNYFSPSSFYSCSQQQQRQQQKQQHLKSDSSPSFSSTVPSSPTTRNIPRKMERDELKGIYQMFDKNGDGRITKKELSDSLESMGIFISDVDLTLMIEKIDSNNDGCVDFDEFGALYQSIMDGHDVEEDMREAFSVFDQNKDGFISFEELKSVLESLGLKQGRTTEDCKEMIMKVDVDGDGMVDFNEFKRMMRGGGFAAALLKN